MSCIHISACQLSCLSSASRAQSLLLDKKSTWFSTYPGTKLLKISLKRTSATFRHQRLAPVCLFGGKGKGENETSPWKALEKAVGNLKKEPSVEDILKKQIEKQEYYDDGGSGGKPPGGGDGDGGDGFPESEDESLSGMLDEFIQVIMATIGFVFLYIYILEGADITVLARDFIKFLFRGQKSYRLRRAMYQWKMFFQKLREKEEDDPYWLEREILNTTTWYDSPVKHRRLMAYLESKSY